MFGTAIAVVLIEYIRSNRKQATKESSVDNKVALLETNTQLLLDKMDTYNVRITELNTVIISQKTKIEEMNNKIGILDNRKNKKYATQASQTTEGRQIGKVIQPKNGSDLTNQASSDVTNSILYQVAEETASILLPFKKSQALIQQQVTTPTPTPTIENGKTAKTPEKKQPLSKTAISAKNNEAAKMSAEVPEIHISKCLHK